MFDFKINLIKLMDNFEIKAGLSVLWSILLTFFTSSDVIYFLLFSLLVILDVATKQLSLATEYIAETKGVNVVDVPFKAKFYGVYLAFNDGIIKSLIMRDKITSKLFTYLTVIGASILTDSLCVGIQGEDSYILYKLSVAYLGATEFLSILENLRDGGNPLAEKLLAVVKKKIDKTF